jgi:excinuclease ABC subunit C
VQPSAQPGEVALFRLTRQGLGGPVPYSTVGMRLHNEQSGSSSLYSHPMTLAAVPLEASPATGPAVDTLEERLAAALHSLEAASPSRPTTSQIEDHLALFTRWCFRPVAKRNGEAIFADAAGSAIPHKALLRSISRVARGSAVAMPAATS